LVDDQDEWLEIQADIGGGNPSALGLVTNKSTDPTALGDNHQVLAYGYDLDAQQNLTIHICDPNSGPDDTIVLSLNMSDPIHITPITEISLEEPKKASAKQSGSQQMSHSTPHTRWIHHRE
jgi:hypothetical protein